MRGSTAATLTMAAAANATAAQPSLLRMTRSTPASTASPTHASLWPPFTTLITVRGLTPRRATAAGLRVRRQMRTRAVSMARAASPWKRRRAPSLEVPATAIPPAEMTVNTGP